MKPTKEEIARARQLLTELLSKPNAIVYVVIRSVAASGMSRTMSFHIHTDERRLHDATRQFHAVLGWGLTPKGYLKVGGCGMDMVFHTVSSVCEALGLDYTKIPHEVI